MTNINTRISFSHKSTHFKHTFQYKKILVRGLLCLPTPLILVCGGSPIIPLLVHQTAYLSITPAGSVHKSRGDSVARMLVQLKRWCVWLLKMGHSGDGCDLVSNLCKYDLRKGDLFVLRWARVRRVRQGSLYLFKAANMWCMCAQYFVIASCG